MATKLSISKSEVMKRAWSIYRNPNAKGAYVDSVSGMGGYVLNTFADCLRRAWELIKERAVNAVKEAVQANQPDINRILRQPVKAGCWNYYNGSGSNGRYFGD